MKTNNRIKRTNGDTVTDVVINTILFLVAVVCLYPVWYVLIASVSSPSAISLGEVVLWPKGFNLFGYQALLDNKTIWIGYRNSILYAFFSTLLALIVELPAAYALSRPQLPGRKWIMTLFIITMYFSGGMIPQYMLLNSLGMINNPLALIVPCGASVFNLIVARRFFESNIPETLLEAARIDGGGYCRFFAKIVVPLSPAIIAIIALYCMMGSWNAFLTPQQYIYSPNLKTLQQVIRTITATLDSSLSADMDVTELITQMQQKQLLKFSVIVVSVVPMVAVYPFVQKFFVKGVTVGAVKG